MYSHPRDKKKFREKVSENFNIFSLELFSSIDFEGVIEEIDDLII
jgi:hypothetical protein